MLLKHENKHLQEVGLNFLLIFETVFKVIPLLATITDIYLTHYYSTVLIKQKVNDSKQIFYYLILAFLSYIYII